MRVLIILLSIRYNVCACHSPKYHYDITVTAVYLIMRRASEASLFSLVFQGKKSLFMTGRTSIGCQK